MIDTPDYSLKNNGQSNNSRLSSTMNWQIIYRVVIYTVLVSLGGGLSYCWYFLTQELVPLMEKQVSNYLSLPVELGKLKSISGNSLHLGQSEIRTGENDNDYVIAEAVEISINPLQLLQKKIVLDLNIIQPRGYLQQNKDRSWLNLQLNNQQEPSIYGFLIRVNQLEIDQGDLLIQSQVKQKKLPSQVRAKVDHVNVNFDKYNSLFYIQGDFVDQGSFQVSGNRKNLAQQWFFDIKANNVASEIITKLNLLNLPLTAKNGNLEADIFLKFDNHLLSDIQGEVNLDQVDITLPNIAQTLTKTEGNILIEKEEIKLDNINTNFGLIPTTAHGQIYENNHLNLNIETKTIAINQAIKSLNLPQPIVETQGKVKAELKITGNMQQPLVEAEVTNIEKVTVDKLIISQALAKLNIVNSQLIVNQLRLTPEIGGEIISTGDISLEDKNPTFNLDWQLREVDGQKLAQVYQQDLPIEVGLLTGEYQLQGNWKQFSDTKLTGNTSFSLAGGKATISNWQLQHRQWRGEVNLSRIPLSQLTSWNCQKIGCQDSFLDGELTLSGDIDNILAKKN